MVPLSPSATISWLPAAVCTGIDQKGKKRVRREVATTSAEPFSLNWRSMKRRRAVAAGDCSSA